MSYEDDDENEVLWDNLNRQEREIHSLRAALDAAQDEIERCIADREALREQVEDLRRRLADPESHRTTWQGIGGAS